MKKVDSAVSKICNFISYISMGAVLVMMFMMIVDIVLRLTVRKGLLGSYEMTELLMVIVMFLAFSYTQMHKGHVRVSMFVDMAPMKVRLFIQGIIEIIAAVVTALMTYAAFVQAGKYAVDKATTAVLYIPYAPFGYIMSIGMLIFTFILLVDAIKTIIQAIHYDGPAHPSLHPELDDVPAEKETAAAEG